jgi:diguanylate cyclase (GGDEF)-like protein/PAS domain S-box-containing protein
MSKLSPTLRLTLGLVSLTVSIACAGQMLGILPDRSGALLDGRRALCEALAVHCSLAVQRHDPGMVEAAVRALVERNPDVRSAALRLADGKTLFEAGEHAAHWRPTDGRRSTPTQVLVPINAGDRRWGTVEVRFAPLTQGGLGFVSTPELRFIAFSASLSGLAFYAFLQLTLMRQLGSAPAGGVSERVRATLDTLVEGVLLMDKDQCIALANQAFARTVGVAAAELEGRPARAFAWARTDEPARAGAYPWSSALSEGRRQVGSLLELEGGPAGRRIMSVNATPIIGDDGAQRGVLATFDDLTVIERKNLQLRRVLDRLKQSRAEIRDQNVRLRELATLDPLTSCLNRRSFFESFDVVWRTGERDGHALSCVMLDIDHFKSINDRHGHAVGDEALRQVSAVLRTLSRGGDLVCRYGGEEFCVVLPQVDLDAAVAAAERFRREIESRRFAGISVTSSFGVATWGLGAASPKELIDQADQALYTAKRTGRNRVVRWDAMPEVSAEPAPPAAEPRAATAVEPPEPVSYPAVTSLISALACRDPDTAAHSRRVADLCVATARGLMSEHDCYQLEVAALLHDIGKLGTPDAILRKPGPLTDREWGVMGAHERMGEEILQAVFPSEAINDVVRYHHAWFTGNPRAAGLPEGHAIPLGARILSIADAYDAMVSDRVYRSGRGREAAFAELRRAAGRQFDPELVGRFIAAVERQHAQAAPLKESLTKRAAFKIGLQIEKLAAALDDGDTGKLATMVSRLKATAAEHGVTPITETSERLQHLVASGGDRLAVTELAGELIDICRYTQRSYLETVEPADGAPPQTRPG